MTGSFVDQLYLPIFFRIPKKGVSFWIENTWINLDLNSGNFSQKWHKPRDYNYSADIIKQRLKNFYTEYAI